METAFTLIVLIISVILHEVSHGYVADALGDPTARLQGRLTLNPVSHADLFGSIILPALMVITHSPFLFGWAKPVPYNPYNLRNQRWGEAMVAAAGPGTNLFLALVFGLLVRYLHGADVVSPEFISLAAVVAYVNILLAFFNLIPFPPLDGSKVLSAFLPYPLREQFHRLEYAFAGNGFIGLVFFMLLFVTVFSGPFSALVQWIFTLITGLSF